MPPNTDSTTHTDGGGDLHIVLGLGPVGRAVVDELAQRGLSVRAVARRDISDLPAGVELHTADLTDRAQAVRAMEGAGVVYHAASAPYHRWPKMLPPIMDGVIAGAGAAGARVVYADNLYAYGLVDGAISEDQPARATGPNGRVRAELAERLMSAHAAGVLRATIGRASDYYGPRGRQSSAGERVFAHALEGRPAQLLGDPDQPHTYTYLRDFARGLVTLGMADEAWGEVWHLPSGPTLTTRQFVEIVFEEAGRPYRVQVLPSPMLTLLSAFSSPMRAVREQQYQRTRPWVVDHAKFERTLGSRPTPHREAIAETLDWYRLQDGLSADARVGVAAVGDGA